MTKHLTLLLFTGLALGQNPVNSFGGLFFGFGGGTGSGGLHIDMGLIGSQNFKNEFRRLELYLSFGSTLNLHSKVYDHSNDLFDDPTVGEESEYFYYAVGPTIKFNQNNMIHIGIGDSRKIDYWEKYDSYQILSDDGRYFIKNDDSETHKLNISFGYTGKISDSYMRYLGIYFNLHPMNITAMLWIG